MTENNYLLSKEQADEAITDLMVRIAVSSYVQQLGEQLTEANKKYKKDPRYQPTPEAKKKIRQMIQRAFRKRSVIKTAKNVYWLANKVALVIVAIMVAFSSTMMVSAEFRNAIYKLVFTHEERYTLVERDPRTDLEFVGYEAYTWEHAFAPTVMPSGYTVSDVLESKITTIVIYAHENGSQIKFFQDNGTADGSINVDTENAQLIENVLINESEGLHVRKDGLNTLVWRSGTHILTLTSDEDSSVLFSIAKGIRLIK